MINGLIDQQGNPIDEQGRLLTIQYETIYTKTLCKVIPCIDWLKVSTQTQSLIYLKYIRGFTDTQLSLAMDMGVSTIKTHLAKFIFDIGVKIKDIIDYGVLDKVRPRHVSNIAIDTLVDSLQALLTEYNNMTPIQKGLVNKIKACINKIKDNKHVWTIE